MFVVIIIVFFEQPIPVLFVWETWKLEWPAGEVSDGVDGAMAWQPGAQHFLRLCFWWEKKSVITGFVKRIQRRNNLIARVDRRWVKRSDQFWFLMIWFIILRFLFRRLPSGGLRIPFLCFFSFFGMASWTLPVMSGPPLRVRHWWLIGWEENGDQTKGRAFLTLFRSFLNASSHCVQGLSSSASGGDVDFWHLQPWYFREGTGGASNFAFGQSHCGGLVETAGGSW